MDFGNILDQWEKGGGSRNAAPGAVRTDKPNPVAVWLRRNGVQDKDAEAATAPQAPEAGAERRRLRQKRNDDALDIHGLTRDEAWTALDCFFSGAQRRGFEKIVIIHGKGNHSSGEAVLKRLVRDYIERCPFAGESGAEKAADGGSGATWVLLKPAE